MIKRHRERRRRRRRLRRRLRRQRRRRQQLALGAAAAAAVRPVARVSSFVPLPPACFGRSWDRRRHEEEARDETKGGRKKYYLSLSTVFTIYQLPPTCSYPVPPQILQYSALIIIHEATCRIRCADISKIETSTPPPHFTFIVLNQATRQSSKQ